MCVDLFQVCKYWFVIAFCSISSQINRIIISIQHDHLHRPTLASLTLLRERITEISFVGGSFLVDGNDFFVVRIRCWYGR